MSDEIAAAADGTSALMYQDIQEIRDKLELNSLKLQVAAQQQANSNAYMQQQQTITGTGTGTGPVTGTSTGGVQPYHGIYPPDNNLGIGPAPLSTVPNIIGAPPTSNFWQEKTSENVAKRLIKTYNGTMRRVRHESGKYYYILFTCVNSEQPKDHSVAVKGRLYQGGLLSYLFHRTGNCIHEEEFEWYERGQYPLENAFGIVINRIEKTISVRTRVEEIQCTPIDSLRAVDEFTQLDSPVYDEDVNTESMGGFSSSVSVSSGS